MKGSGINDLEFYKSLKDFLSSINIEKDLQVKFTKQEKEKIQIAKKSK
jgi:hypothetical protein